jgi:hypothetical protein
MHSDPYNASRPALKGYKSNTGKGKEIKVWAEVFYNN